MPLLTEIREKKPHDVGYPAVLVLLQKLIRDGEIARKINEDSDLEHILPNIAEGLRKGNIRYLLGRFPDESQKKKVREFFRATGEKIGETPNPFVIAAIGEAYLGDSDQNIHHGILGKLYNKLGLKREEDAKINVGEDPFYKVGVKLLQIKKPLSNQELVEAIGEPHAKMFFAESCKEDGIKSDDALFAQWKSFAGERPEFAEKCLSGAFVASKEHKVRMPEEDRKKSGSPTVPKKFDQKVYDASYENYQKTSGYQSVDHLSWDNLFKEIKTSEVKERGSIAYDFESLKSLLPGVKIPLSGTIPLPKELAEKIDQKLAIELQKTEYKFKR